MSKMKTGCFSTPTMVPMRQVLQPLVMVRGWRNVELDGGDDLARLNVKLHDVVHLDDGVRVSDGAAVMRGEARDHLGGDVDLVDAAELEALLLAGDQVRHEAALGVVHQSELVAGCVQRDDVNETGRVRRSDEAIALRRVFRLISSLWLSLRIAS
jgi:hypothetical protein